MNPRLRFLFGVFVFLFFILWLKLFIIQILEHNKYQRLASSQHWRTLEVPARRGRVFSADGFTLVDNKTVYLLYARPKEIKNEKENSEKLGELIFNEDLYTPAEKKIGLGNLKINFAKSLGLKRAGFSLFKPFPGTEVTRQLVEKGELKEMSDEDWAHFILADAVYAPSGFTKNDMRKLRRKALLHFYLRPKIFFKFLGEIKSPKHLKIVLKRIYSWLFKAK